MLRKRYRPLDAVEERTVGVEQILQIGLLHDEQSYCFSWPEAPLTSLLRRSNDSLVVGMQGCSTPVVQRTVSQPPVWTADTIRGFHGELTVFNYRTTNHALIAFSPGSDFTALQRLKRPTVAPESTSTDDSIFSFTIEQIADLKAVGAFEAFYRTDKSSNTRILDDKRESLARLEMEREVINLEWRAFHEAEKTAPALQRILPLTTAVPFFGSGNRYSEKKKVEGNDEWRRLVYEKWVEWRQRRGSILSDGDEVDIDCVVLSWGSPLLPGAFRSTIARDYFLQMIDDRSGPKKPGKLNERIGFDDDQGLSTNVSRRRGAYNFLRWRVDRYEPRLRSGLGAARGGHSMGGGTMLLSDDDINKLISEKIPPALTSIELDERVDPVDALALIDIHNEVETWRSWLAHV